MECSIYVCPKCHRTFRIKGMDRSIKCVDCGDIYLNDMHVDANLWETFKIGHQTRVVERALNEQSNEIHEAMAHICPSCGESISSNAKFCPNCGEKNNAYDTENEEMLSREDNIEGELKESIHEGEERNSRSKYINDLQVRKKIRDNRSQFVVLGAIILLVIWALFSIPTYYEPDEENVSDITDMELTDEAQNGRSESSTKYISKMSGTNIDRIMEEATQYGVIPLNTPERLYPDYNVLLGEYCNADSSLQMDLVYDGDTKQILCALLRVNGQAGSDFIISMSSLLCPASHSYKVSKWVSSNIGNDDGIMINGFDYSTEVGPNNSIIYYAGYQKWVDWDATVDPN